MINLFVIWCYFSNKKISSGIKLVVHQIFMLMYEIAAELNSTFSINSVELLEDHKAGIRLR